MCVARRILVLVFSTSVLLLLLFRLNFIDRTPVDDIFKINVILMFLLILLLNNDKNSTLTPLFSISFTRRNDDTLTSMNHKGANKVRNRKREE